ncbi:hypothetical protein CoNPh17_CDS0110 [Staphylococcus phage S-CoN_Ph17]|nr:hypothetical protein CoNPh17_CDS0110 [Staphylococcus phage S-CoN_Ph17]
MNILSSVILQYLFIFLSNSFSILIIKIVS